MKRYLAAVVFWGSLWGIAEASLGNLLHLAAIALPGLPGFLMFPVAFFFMKKGFDSTGRVWSIFHIAAIAAAIKMADFLLPVYIPIRIINPAICILLEGLVVACAYRIYTTREQSLTGPAAFVMGAAWRTIFLGYLFIISRFGLPAALVTDGILVSLRFVILESLVNSIIICACLRWGDFKLQLEARPHWAAGALLLSLGTQLLI